MQRLCQLYAASYRNQKIDVNKNTPLKCFNARIENLDRQFPENMRELCERYGVEL